MTGNANPPRDRILPKISVVIPTYNRASLVREAVESVLAQTYPVVQVIVVDDGSTDNTAEALSRFADRIELVHRAQGGISAARNTGIDAATGTFIAFLDNDDLWMPDKLEKQVDFALSHPGCAVTYTDAIQFDENGPRPGSFVEKFPALKNPERLFAPMITEYAIPLMSTAIIDAAFLREHGLRFQNFLGIDDLMLFLEIMLRGGRFGYLPERLTMRRMHAGNFSGNHRRRFEQRKRMYSAMLASSASLRKEQKQALEAGLRDARFRVAECSWEEFRLKEARADFLLCLGADKRGLQAITYGMLSLLPQRSVAALRGLRRTTQ